MLKIRRPLGRLIFNMGIAIPGKTVFLIETAPCCLAAIAGTTILVPYRLVISLRLIWRLGTRKWNLRVPNLQMSCSDLTEKTGHQQSSPSTLVSLIIKHIWLFMQRVKSAVCSFICCNRYIVKQRFYYSFSSKFCRVFIYFDMFYYSEHLSNGHQVDIITCPIGILHLS